MVNSRDETEEDDRGHQRIHRPPPQPESDGSALAKTAALMLGLLLRPPIAPGVLGRGLGAEGARRRAGRNRRRTRRRDGNARDDARAHRDGGGPGAELLGLAPDNADALAAAHKPYPAALAAAPAGPVAVVHLTLEDVVHEVAPGIKYSAWAFSGGAPGPVIHVRQGQTVKMTLTNGGAIPHSIDFHAARIAPNLAFKDVAPGQVVQFSFKASDPGVYMYHCGTKPVLMHIANGMYGAIIVEPADAAPEGRPRVRLVSSEWYLNAPGLKTPAGSTWRRRTRWRPTG